ncbi:MAG: R3H domain-containing nucleic acid-binding protein [Candidatus Paceibacterota bacterium]|jgi:spoIIIJ-associated protein
MENKKPEELIKEFFEKMGCPVILEVSAEGNVLHVNIRSEDTRLLIGQGGQTLADLQHLLAKMIKNAAGEGEQIFLDLDVEDYKKRKIDHLKEMAWEIADEVASTGRDKELPSLSAFDRRVVHMELAGRTDVKTESAGEGLDRKIVIKPA